jgi:lipopolysaccharide assembly outer membrane protein LptD (OstA)
MLITAALYHPLAAQEGTQLSFQNDSSFALTDTSTTSIEQPSDSLQSKIDTSISEDAIESRVDYVAKDSMRIDMEIEKVYLYGEAQVNYENIQLNADYIEVDLRNNTVLANGRPDSSGKMQGLPVFKEGNQQYEAGKMTYNFETKKGKISEVKTQEGEGFIKGNEVKKTATEVLYIRDGYYTTCNLDEPHFSLATSKLKIIPNDKIVTGPTVLKVDGVPTPLGLPFGFFPNKKGRSSGILIPTYGDSRRRGFFLRNGGFYWGISEYVDASITADIYSLGSWGSNLNSRYKKRYQYGGNVNLSYSKIIDSYKEFPDYSESNEVFVRWSHSQDAKARPGSRFSANVNVGSRNNFVNNLNSFTQDYLTNTFQSSISYSNSLTGTPFNLSVSARHNQNTQTGAFNVTLPDVSLNMTRQYPFKQMGKIGNEWWRSIYKNFGLSYNSTATNQLRTGDTLISLNNLGNLTQDFRNGVRHNIPISTSFKLLKHANLNPSFNYSEVWAFETIRKTLNPATNDAVRDTVAGFERAQRYNFNTALTTKFYSLYQYKKGKIKAIRHVMTPSVSFNYQPEIRSGIRSYADTSGKEIRYSVFEGGVYGVSNQRRSESVGFSLLNNIEMKVKSSKDSTGVKKITLLENLGFSTNYNITAESLNWSPISANGRTRIGQFLTLQFNGVLDPYGLDSVGNKINTSWKKQEGKLFRLTSGSVALSFSLRGGKGKQKEKKTSKYATEEELEYINNNLDQYIDFTVPWSLNVGYNIRYSKPGFESNVTQTLNFSGDLSVTENWKVGFNSGWDFERKDFTYTALNINRDLHCWQLAINWIPYGPRQSYNLTLNVKSSVLQDLKLNRRKDFYDIIN